MTSANIRLARTPPFALTVLGVAALLCCASAAHAGPAGGVVAAGSAAIATAPGKTTITQTSSSAVINWRSFGIAAGESVQFVQPGAASVVLNRVQGPDPSAIFGSLSANGKVFLVNPSGVLFGSGASVNVGGLVASTLDIGDAAFMAGRFKFAGAGKGSVINEGAIDAPGGYVALLGASVSNQGTITATRGSIALAAGNAITLDVMGNKLLGVQVEEGAVNAAVRNGGLIQADGGQILLTAQAAGKLLSTVVNNTGVIRAQTLSSENGTIKLLAGMDDGRVNAGGTLDASAPHGGNGGFIETSAAQVRMADSLRITTAAPAAKTGTWLIDPVDYTIAAANGDITGTMLGAALGTSNVTILSSAGAQGVRGDINVKDTVAWSANRLTLNAQNNINIDAAMTGTVTASLVLEYGQQAVAAGNLSGYTVLAPVNLPAGNNFSTKLGSNGVPVNYVVITSLGAQGSVSGTDLQGMAGNVAGNYALGSNIDAGPTAGWNAGAGFDPVGKIAAPENFTGNFDGLGHTINALTIARPLTDNVGLFGYAVGAPGATMRNVTLSGGSVTGANYVGNLVGHNTGQIINSRSTQSVSGASYVGNLVGWNTGNLSYNSASGSVTGTADYIGGLAGWVTGNILCCSATGTVVGAGSYVGGLVGWVTGDVSRSFATGNVSTNALYVGGLAGWVTGNTSNTYAQGNVTTAGGNVGGLIGWNDGNLSNSYSSGAVAGAVPVGGLVGFMNGGTVSNSFWDTTSSGQALSAGGAGVRGMPTADMREQLNFTAATPDNIPLAPNWNFATIWTMTEGVTYPSLQACLAPVSFVAVPAPPAPAPPAPAPPAPAPPAPPPPPAPAPPAVPPPPAPVPIAPVVILPVVPVPVAVVPVPVLVAPVVVVPVVAAPAVIPEAVQGSTDLVMPQFPAFVVAPGLLQPLARTLSVVPMLRVPMMMSVAQVLPTAVAAPLAEPAAVPVPVVAPVPVVRVAPPAPPFLAPRPYRN